MSFYSTGTSGYMRVPLMVLVLIMLQFSVFSQEYSLEQGTAYTASRLEQAIPAGSILAVLDCAARSPELGEYVRQELVQFFVNSRKLVVVDRSDIDKVKSELTFQLSGDVSDESAQSIGKMLGAQIILTSTLDESRILRIKAIEVETARILGMERVRIREDSFYTALLSGGSGRKVIDVHTADELIAAIASDKTIRLKKGVYDISSSSHIKNRNVSWVDEYDGPCPVIKGVSNITFIGEEGAEIVIKPAYGWVFSFENCSGISISGIIFGHSVPGYCLGGVLRFKNCETVEIRYSDLYGSGTIGLSLEYSTNVAMSNSTIRDCTYGLVAIQRSGNILFSGTEFRNTGEYSLIEVSGSENIVWSTCVFYKNFGSTLFSIDTTSSGIRAEFCSFIENNVRQFSGKRKPELSSSIFDGNLFGVPEE